MSIIASLEAHLGYLMRMASNAVSHEFALRMAEQNVTVAEWALMRTLYDVDAEAPTALAETMGLTKGAVSKLAERLLAKGLVARLDHPTDRRAHSLSLTRAGRAKVPILAAIADENDAAFFDVLSGDEQAHLKHLLQHLIKRCQLRTVPTN